MLASKIGPFNAVIPGIYVVSILIFCSLGVAHTSGVMIFAVLYGFFSGTCKFFSTGAEFYNCHLPLKMRVGYLPW
jgi:hypothetical protein